MLLRCTKLSRLPWDQEKDLQGGPFLGEETQENNCLHGYPRMICIKNLLYVRCCRFAHIKKYGAHIKKKRELKKGKKEEGRNYIITSWFLVSDSIDFLVIKEQNLLVTFIQTSAELPCVGPKTLKVNVIDFHMFRYAIAFTQVRNCTYVCRMAKSICTNLWRLESQ